MPVEMFDLVGYLWVARTLEAGSTFGTCAVELLMSFAADDEDAEARGEASNTASVDVPPTSMPMVYV